MFRQERMDRAGRRYSFWCRYKLLVCISVFSLQLVLCEVPARQCGSGWRNACQLRCLWPFGCYRSKLCHPLMRRRRAQSWRGWTRSGRGDRPCEPRCTVAKHCNEAGYIMRCREMEQLVLNAGEGKEEVWYSFRAIELPSPQVQLTSYTCQASEGTEI